MRAAVVVCCLVVLSISACAAQNVSNATALNATAHHGSPAPPSPTSAWLPTTSVFSATTCSAVEIQAATVCQEREAAALVSKDSCESIAVIVRCWPKCFCIHSLGYQQLFPTLRPLCATLPACGPQPPTPVYTPSSRAPRAAHGAPGGCALAATLASALALTFFM